MTAMHLGAKAEGKKHESQERVRAEISHQCGKIDGGPELLANIVATVFSTSTPAK
jgi:hypothetical protein